MASIFGTPDALDEFVQSIDFEGLEIGERLGSGNFSVVYQGTFNSTRVAVKVFTSESPDTDRESQVLQLIKGCPHAQQFIAAPESYPIQITELVDSAPQRSIDQSLTLVSLRAILQSVLECLAAVHARGIVHRV
jgi:serine/threonine protein kinase